MTFGDGTEMHIPELVRRPAHKPAGCNCNHHSPFLWACHLRPSIFSGENAFASRNGRSQSQIATENADAHLAEYGRSMAMGWIGKTGPVKESKKLAVVSKKGRG